LISESPEIEFEEFVKVVRSFCVIFESLQINQKTRLELDLGITGDNGEELFRHLFGYFKIPLPKSERDFREMFKLKPGEKLFHSEGVLPMVKLVKSVDFIQFEQVYPITMGELFEALFDLKST